MNFLKSKLFNISYMKLQKLIKIKKGQQLNKEFLYKKNEKDINLFPVINGGKEPSGWWDKSNFDKNLITISQGGASCGYVQWQHTKFWAGAHCYVIMIINNKLNYKFIYYFLKNKENLLMKNQKGAGIPSLDTKTIYNLEIPIPPMEEQNKIVEILDKFTNYKAELTSELTFRKEQYKYYRDKLNNFNLNSKLVRVGDVCLLKRGEVISKIFINNNKGIFPVYSSQTNNNGEIGKINSYKYDGEYLTWTTDGAYAGTVFYRKGKFNITNVCGLLENKDPDKLNIKYLYYILHKYAPLYVNKNTSNPKLMSNVMSDIKIPIPPIETQNKIVEILDKFSSLTNNILDGLPKEIELRNKQYKYYRNLLLDFKEKNE